MSCDIIYLHYSIICRAFLVPCVRLVEWNISSFNSWKILYHCTHKHSIFVYQSLTCRNDLHCTLNYIKSHFHCIVFKRFRILQLHWYSKLRFCIILLLNVNNNKIAIIDVTWGRRISGGGGWALQLVRKCPGAFFQIMDISWFGLVPSGFQLLHPLFGLGCNSVS